MSSVDKWQADLDAKLRSKMQEYLARPRPQKVTVEIAPSEPVEVDLSARKLTWTTPVVEEITISTIPVKLARRAPTPAGGRPRAYSDDVIQTVIDMDAKDATLGMVSAATGLTEGQVSGIRNRHIPKRVRVTPPRRDPPVRWSNDPPKPKTVKGTTSEEQAKMDAWLASNAPTRKVDFGVHQAVVDVAREAYNMVFRLPPPAQSRPGRVSSWLWNGSPCTTEELYSRVNVILLRRGLPKLEVPKD